MLPHSPVRVTFVMPVFNKAQYVESCLQSVRDQSLADTEIICIDDASTDRSGEILLESCRVDSRIRVVRNQANLGAAEARNIGIELARGRFVRFVDADDLLPLESTALLYSTALATGADVVRGSLALFRGTDPERHECVAPCVARAATTLREEPGLWTPWWHTSYLISRRLIRDNGLRYPPLRQGEDPVFLAAVLACANRISMVEDIVYLYRKYRKSSGSAGSSFAGVVDFLKHAGAVKAIYVAYHADCWDRGYGPFVLDDFRKVLARCDLDTEQMQFVAREAGGIFGGDARLA